MMPKASSTLLMGSLREARNESRVPAPLQINHQEQSGEEIGNSLLECFKKGKSGLF